MSDDTIEDKVRPTPAEFANVVITGDFAGSLKLFGKLACYESDALRVFIFVHPANTKVTVLDFPI